MVEYTPRQLNTIISYRIAENFRGRIKTFTNFAALEPPVKVFSMKFGRAIPTYAIGFSSFLHEMITSLYQSVKNFFSLKSFPLCGTLAVHGVLG